MLHARADALAIAACLVHKFNRNDTRPSIGWEIGKQHRPPCARYINKNSIARSTAGRALRAAVGWFASKCVTSDATHAISVKSLEKIFSFFSLRWPLLLGTGKTSECHLIRLTKAPAPAQHNRSQSNRRRRRTFQAPIRSLLSNLKFYRHNNNGPRAPFRTFIVQLLCAGWPLLTVLLAPKFFVSHTKCRIQWFGPSKSSFFDDQFTAKNSRSQSRNCSIMEESLRRHTDSGQRGCRARVDTCSASFTHVGPMAGAHDDQCFCHVAEFTLFFWFAQRSNWIRWEFSAK